VFSSSSKAKTARRTLWKRLAFSSAANYARKDLGLTLAEARDLLRGLQQSVAAEQTAQFADEQTHCPSCGKHRARKGQHEIVFRTAFGKLACTVRATINPKSEV
jgi:hypothetical protein